MFIKFQLRSQRIVLSSPAFMLHFSPSQWCSRTLYFFWYEVLWRSRHCYTWQCLYLLRLQNEELERITIIPDVCSDAQSHIVTSMKSETFWGFIFSLFFQLFLFFSPTPPPQLVFFFGILDLSTKYSRAYSRVKVRNFPEFSGTDPPTPSSGYCCCIGRTKPINRFTVCKSVHHHIFK
jgi:hypothetical protein